MIFKHYLSKYVFNSNRDRNGYKFTNFVIVLDWTYWGGELRVRCNTLTTAQIQNTHGINDEIFIFGDRIN